jgi:hypothetical protein
MGNQLGHVRSDAHHRPDWREHLVDRLARGRPYHLQQALEFPVIHRHREVVQKCLCQHRVLDRGFTEDLLELLQKFPTVTAGAKRIDCGPGQCRCLVHLIAGSALASCFAM